MFPTFIGIGGPKTGTTWLFRCLQEHPEIFMAAVKETNFFDYDTIAGRLQAYEAHFVERAVAVGEISTRYLASSCAPVRIKTYIPGVRLLVSLRNPVEQVYSHYWHLLRQNFHQWDRKNVPQSFEAALETYEEKLLEPAFYYKHLNRWRQYFDWSQLLIIFYDDICARPREVLRPVYAFLGVDSSFLPSSLNRNGSSVRRGMSPRSPILGRLHTLLYDWLSRHVYYRCKQLVGVRTAIRLKDALKIRQFTESFFLHQGYPEMCPETRAYLRERFTEDIQNLAGLTGRDLSHWH